MQASKTIGVPPLEITQFYRGDTHGKTAVYAGVSPVFYREKPGI
jgi:hypothetical protein